MIHRVAILLLSLTLLNGCATKSESTARTESQVKIVPDPRLHGRIASVNTQGQFVVVDFNVGRIPPLHSRMQLFRGNKAVGVINLSGPVNDNLVAADVIEGEPAVGDIAIWNTDPPSKTEQRDQP